MQSSKTPCNLQEQETCVYLLLYVSKISHSDIKTTKMYKPLDVVYRVSFCIFFMALIAGINFLATSQGAYKQAVLVGTLASSIVIICSIYEVLSSKQAKTSEKLIWIVAFLLFNIAAALVFFLLNAKG